MNQFRDTKEKPGGAISFQPGRPVSRGWQWLRVGWLLLPQKSPEGLFISLWARASRMSAAIQVTTTAGALGP